MEKLLVNDKIAAGQTNMLPMHYVLYQKLQITNKNKFWKTVRLTSVEKNKTKQKTIAIVSVSFKSVHACLHCTILCYYNLLSTFGSVLCVFMFHCREFGVNSLADCLNFDRWRQLRKCPCNIAKANRSKNVCRKTLFKPSHLFCWLFEEAKLANYSNPELD